MLSKTQAIKKRLVELLRSESKIKLSPVFGTERDLGISLVFYVGNSTQAKEVAEAITAEGIPAQLVYDPDANDQHVYANWEFLMNKQDPWGGSYPWSSPLYKGAVDYSPKSCPRTLDLLGRAVQIRLNHLVEEEDIQDVVTAVRKVVHHFL